MNEQTAGQAAQAAGAKQAVQTAEQAAQAGAVDMVATARAVQQEADGWGGPGVLKLIAPAKVNLFLGIGPRRSDDYHEATSILHAIALHDVLYVRRAPTPERLAGAGEAALFARGGQAGDVFTAPNPPAGQAEPALGCCRRFWQRIREP